VVQDVRKDHKNEFALAIAEGESIIAWAREYGVPECTAFRCALDPKVRREAEATRRRALGRAIDHHSVCQGFSIPTTPRDKDCLTSEKHSDVRGDWCSMEGA
jgi:hypothetical protein